MHQPLVDVQHICGDMVHYSMELHHAGLDHVVGYVFHDVRMNKLQPDEVCRFFFELL